MSKWPSILCEHKVFYGHRVQQLFKSGCLQSRPYICRSQGICIFSELLKIPKFIYHMEECTLYSFKPKTIPQGECVKTVFFFNVLTPKHPITLVFQNHSEMSVMKLTTSLSRYQQQNIKQTPN